MYLSLGGHSHGAMSLSFRDRPLLMER